MNLTLAQDKKDVLLTLSDTWPVQHRLVFDGDQIANLQSHVLKGEIVAVLQDRKCCLPFFIAGAREIAWFNIARDADEVQSTIHTLRYWFIPSYGWEDDRGWIVTETNGFSLADSILKMSPAGYCRWRSKQTDFEFIVKKLAQIRSLDSAMPELPPNGPPPLIQIRQQFVTSLVAGDKASAEDAIGIIESHQLDTADNTLFMWVRLWFTFRDFGRISRHKDIPRLTQLRVPKVIQQCLVRAFYFASLGTFDWDTDVDTAIEAYRLDVHCLIGSLIWDCQNNEGVEILRLRACYAVVNEDLGLARELVHILGDSSLATTLKSMMACVPTSPEVSLEEQFLMARIKKDWERVQALGTALLKTEPEIYGPLLRQSLEFIPNCEIERQVEEVVSIGVSDAKDEAGDSKKHKPDSWASWLDAFSRQLDADFVSFLTNRPVIALDNVDVPTLVTISSHLEHIYLSSSFSSDPTGVQLLLSGLPELMQDFINEPQFPRDTLLPIYTNVFRIWSELKCGSVHPPDSQVLLNLADGILSFDRTLESEIVRHFEEWWDKSPVKALLPFLLGVVELLNNKGTEEQCSNYWITGATYLKANPQCLTVGERNLWRQIGLQFLDLDTIDEYLPIPPEVEDTDPLQAAGLRKVAIVSMREPQARAAAEMIKERSGADVVLVTQKSAGAQTDSAITSDVVIFVWKSTSHAVFRAFDDMDKQKLAYVQGTGSGSILIALERWIANSELAMRCARE